MLFEIPKPKVCEHSDKVERPGLAVLDFCNAPELREGWNFFIASIDSPESRLSAQTKASYGFTDIFLFTAVSLQRCQRTLSSTKIPCQKHTVVHTRSFYNPRGLTCAKDTTIHTRHSTRSHHKTISDLRRIQTVITYAHTHARLTQIHASSISFSRIQFLPNQIM